MTKLSKQWVQSLLQSFQNKKILVLGDLMLDRYLVGQVSRLSPEAPVPIVEVEEEYTRLGGAANVSNNIKALGAIPYLVGIIGEDNFGREMKHIINDQGLSSEGIVVDPERPTTVKTRIIAHNQHVVRTDRESRIEIGSEMSNRIKEVISRLIKQVDAVIIEDYNKGLITKDIINFVVSSSQKLNKVITVDPKFDHFFEFHNVTVFKPNRRETEEALGIRMKTKDQIIQAAQILFKKLNCKCLMITLGEEGMAVFNSAQEAHIIPTRARTVHDVSGAGDTVISMITLSLSSGANFEEAATLANFAAGIVCGEVGIVPITPERLLNGIFYQS